MNEFFVTVIDHDGGFTIPESALTRFGWTEGTLLMMRETPDGVELSAAD